MHSLQPHLRPVLVLRCCALATSLAWLAGCGTAPVKPTPASSESPSTPPPSSSIPPAQGVESPAPTGLTESEVRKLDPKAYAARFRRPTFCEQAARAIRPLSATKAWEALSACVDKGDFKLLERLLDGVWLEDLKKRPDAPKLIVKVIAARGGDDVLDGALLRARKVPFFTLEAAVRQPGIFRGQLILLRANVAELRTPYGEGTVRLQAKGFARPNEIRIIGRLAKPDPLFEQSKELILVARFEGLEEKPGDGSRPGEWIAVLSAIGYAEPATTVIE